MHGLLFLDVLLCARGEMDITAVFGTVIGGSSPSGRTEICRICILIIGYLLKLRYTSSKSIVSCGYGLMVGRVLAKDEVGVRFSLPAPGRTSLD
jgi:hypothetical protein